MKEPKGSVLLLALTVLIVAESAPVIQEEKLPHSQDYYDGYVKALVDHFDDLFRNAREVSADNSESKVADVASQEAAKKDDIQSARANGERNISERSQQANDQNNTVQDRPYTNPEETGKTPASDTEKEEQPTPDAHLNKEDKQMSTSPEETKQNMFKAEDTTSMPETMQDVKLYTGKSMDFEDMKKRSTDIEASTNEKSVTAKTFVFKPKESSSASTVPAAIPLSLQATQTFTASASAPVVAAANVPVATAANAPLMAPVSVPAAQSVAAVAQVPVTSSATPAATSTVSQPNQENAKRNDMQSESKVISHSSSTYTPGDPSKTPPQQVPTPPDPNKEEPYKKDEKNEIEEEEKQNDAENSKSVEEDPREEEGQNDAENSKSIEEAPKVEEKQEDAENSKSMKEDPKEEERQNDAENVKSMKEDPKEEEGQKDAMDEDPKEEEIEKDADYSKSIEEDPKEEEQTNEKPKEENTEDANKNMKEADKEENNDSAENVDNYDAGKKEGDKEFSKESDEEEDNEEERGSTSVQPFMGMVLLPMEEMRNAGSLLGSAGERKDNVGAKRGDGDKKKDDKKDDDDDEHHDHAYIAPLWGYPGWYEAGHGIPYGYGTNMLYGCGGYHRPRGHHCIGLGDLGYGHYGLGGYGLGHHGYGLGHHGYGFGHHGYGYGHHGFGHHGGLRLDNGVIWPYGGEVVAFFNTPCGCSSEPFGSNVGHSLPVSI